MNGYPVERRQVDADGQIRDLVFHYTPDISNWTTVRILPRSHTNPMFVEVNGKPIRISKRSAQWCLDSVHACWASKSPLIREEERVEAAYEFARNAYRHILADAYDDHQGHTAE